MYYVMRLTEGVATRYGRMMKSPQSAVKLATRIGNAYVEKYGHGVVWTPKATSLTH